MGKATLAKMVAGSGLLLGLVLTGCGAPQGQQAAGVTSTTSASPSHAAADTAQGMSCTNKIDYTGDERSNAEINSIGAETGTCPPVRKPPATQPSPDMSRCTNKIDYSNDPRSNAEINSIGVETGTCPQPQH